MSGGGILGGIEVAGLGLTAGQVAILLLGALGVYYAYNAATTETLGYDLEELLEAEVTNAQLSAQQSAEYAAALSGWWESAKAGAIELVSAPAWILNTIKVWATGFINGSSSISIAQCPELGVGSLINTHGSTVEVTSCASPVYSFIICCNGQHYTRIFSRSKFSVSSASHINSPSRVNRSGIYFYYTGWSMSGSISDMTGHNPTSDNVDHSTTLDMMADILSNGSPVTDVYPDVITGGITDQISQGIGMDVIGIPDIVIPGPDVLPVKPSEGQTTAQAVTDYLMAALIAGEITWEQYWQLIGVYNPAIGSSVPTVGTLDPVTGTITNTEISTGVVVTPSPIQNFHVDLTSFFPFCIPFDFYEFIRILCAEPEAPVFHWEVQDLSGNVYSVDVDLSPWNPHAQLFRDAQCLLFIIGLLMLTRKFIKW